MNALLTMVQAQVVRLWRAKTPLIVALLGPLLVMMLVGVAYDGQTAAGIRVGAYVPDASGLSADVLATLESNRVLVRSYDNESACQDAVRSGERHACLVFSSPFGLAAGNNTIAIVIDGSNLALAGVLAEGLFTNLENQSTMISANLTSQLVGALDSVQRSAAQGKAYIVTLTTSNTDALNALKTGEAALAGVDASVSVSNISVGSVEEGTRAIENATSSAIATANKLLYAMRADLANVSASVNASNATSAERTQVAGLVGDVTEGLEKAINEMAALNRSVNGSVKTVSASLSVVQDQFVQAKDKIAVMVGAKSAVATQLANAQQSLTQALVQVTQLQQSLDAIQAASKDLVTDPSRVARPIRSVVRPLKATTRLAGVSPALLVLVVAFGGLLLTPRLVNMERHSGARLRMALLPFPRELQTVATVITGCIVIAAQALVLVLILALLFSQSVAAPLSTFLVLLITGVSFVLLGTAVSQLFATEEAALLVTLALGTALLMISGIIVPIEWMPSGLAAIARYNPILIAVALVRQTAVFGTWVIGAHGIGSLLAWLVAAVLLAAGSLLSSRDASLERLRTYLRNR